MVWADFGVRTFGAIVGEGRERQNKCCSAQHSQEK